MRFMIIRKSDMATEAGAQPRPELQLALSKYTTELARAGVLLASEWLHPSTRGARLKFWDGKPEVAPWPIRQCDGTDGQLRLDPGQIPGRGHRMGETLAGDRRWRRIGDRGPPGARRHTGWAVRVVSNP